MNNSSALYGALLLAAVLGFLWIFVTSFLLATELDDAANRLVRRPRSASSAVTTRARSRPTGEKQPPLTRSRDTPACRPWAILGSRCRGYIMRIPFYFDLGSPYAYRGGDRPEDAVAHVVAVRAA